MSNCCGSFITNPCPSLPDAQCIVYTGDDLTCIGVLKNSYLDDILVKINDILCSTGSLEFNNWLTNTDGIVQFGGTLIQNTIIDFAGFDVNIDNIRTDNTAPFLMAIDSSGNWVAVDATTFATTIPAITLPSTTADNGLNATFDFSTKNYNIELGGTLIKDTVVDWDTFGLLFGNATSGIQHSSGSNSIYLYTIPGGDVVDNQSYIYLNGSNSNFQGVSLYALAGGTTVNSGEYFYSGVAGTGIISEHVKNSNNGDNLFVESLYNATRLALNGSGVDYAQMLFTAYKNNHKGAKIRLFGNGKDGGPEIQGEIWLQTSPSVVSNTGTYKGLKILSTSDVQLENYPNTRNDGATTKALYVDVNGNIKHGSVSTGISGSFTTVDGKTVTVTNGLITNIV